MEALAVHGNPNPSHVLIAIGDSEEEAKSALRITLGRENTKEDIDFLIWSIGTILNGLKNRPIGTDY